MKNFIISLIVIVALGFGIYLLIKNLSVTKVPEASPTPTETNATTTVEQRNPEQTVIGRSVEGRDITAYHYGTGSKELMFVGGIHGGYEWNTVLAAYELLDYVKANPNVIPSNIKITIVPVLNPDGLNKTVGAAGRFKPTEAPTDLSETVSGRFNANGVDLNRNFDCDWQASGTWQNKKVSGGDSVFSEPESQAMRDYVTANKPSAVVVWYSAAGGVYSSSCHNGVSAETSAITKIYADASGYPAYQDFDFYEITGDMVNWLAKENIPAISVLLTNHTSTEWTKNQKGFEALLKYYSK